MIEIAKPNLSDLESIRSILSFWTDKPEVDKYIARVSGEINGSIEYNLHFWVARLNSQVVGITGLCDPLPKIMSFAQSPKPGEIKIIYVDSSRLRSGIGKQLVNFIEDEAARFGYQELLVRSAERYRDTAYAFYENLGYFKVGTTTGGDDLKPMQVFRKLLIKPL